ncbi:hypothetical protein LCGC14_1077820, partial [marine sediment metagenome]
MLPDYVSKKGDLSINDATKVAYIITGRAMTYTSVQIMLQSFLISLALGIDNDLDEELVAK